MSRALRQTVEAALRDAIQDALDETALPGRHSRARVELRDRRVTLRELPAKRPARNLRAASCSHSLLAASKRVR